MIISEVVVPHMFTSYAQDMGYLRNGLHQIQYFCEECDQAFAAAWGRSGIACYQERGTTVLCPYCGHEHTKHIGFGKQGQAIPNKVRLCVKEYQKFVLFEISCDIVYFNELFSLHASSYKETFRFDIAKQKTTFSRRTYPGNCGYDFELGDPFNLDLRYESILGYFQSGSLANTRQRSELTQLLKTLRETIQSKLEKQLKHKVKSMYVSPGEIYGTFLMPIFNIAYRLKRPDFPNLPAAYRYYKNVIDEHFSWHMLDDENRVCMQAGSIDEMIQIAGLPNKPAVRRELTENPFEVGRLQKAFTLCENYDLAMQLHSLLRQMSSMRGYNNVLAFLAVMLPIYREAGIISLVEDSSKINLIDCSNLYRQLNDTNRQALIDEKVKLKELHDWMAKRHRQQTHKNVPLNIPEHIVKRLSMQKDRLQFFLPKESMDLLEAGVDLHNCVASYSEAVKDHKKWIVLVADEKGRLAACLEIRDKTLVQAKLNYNKPVMSDKALNAEVIAWAKETGLEIKTNDVQEIKEVKNYACVV